MGPFRKLLLVGVGVLALHGVQACSNETELNPQPLPPQGGEGTGGGTEPTPADPAKNSGGGSDTTAGASGGPPPAPGSADAGAEGGGDAADGGDG